MSQIAQQDHLYVYVAAVDDLTADEKAILLEKVKNKSILDVVLQDESGNVAKILGYAITDDEVEIGFYSVPDGSLISVTISA